MDEKNIHDLYEADVLRSLTAVANSWENDELSIAEMTEHLDGIIEIVLGRTDYRQFIKKVALKDITYS